MLLVTDPQTPPRPRPAADAWLRNAFDVAAVGLASIDRDGVHVAANPAYLQHLGLTRRHVVKQPLASLMEAAAASIVEQWIADPHNAAFLQFSTPQPDGSELDLVGWISPLPLTEESARAVVQIVPVASAPAANEASARFSAIAATTSDLLLIVDAAGRIEFASGAARTSFGLASGGPIELQVSDLLAHDNRDQVNELLRTTRGSFVETQVTVQLASGDADRRLRVSEVREPGGRLLGLAYLFADMGDTQSAISSSAEPAPVAAVLDAFLTATAAPVWVLNSNGPVAATEGARSLLGLGVEDDVTSLGLSDVLPRWAADELIAHGFGAVSRHGSWSAPLALNTATDELLAEVTLRYCSGPPELWTISGRPVATDTPDPLAVRDHITDLPNKVVLIDRLNHAFERAARSGQPTALVIFDIDHFGPIFDAVGPDMAERLLSAVAKRLQANLRPGDTLARAGDDEFAAVRDDIGDIRDAERFAERLRSCVDDPLVVDGVEWFLSLSAGVALTQPGVTTIEGLFRNSTAALDRAKEAGRGRSVVFGQALKETSKRRSTTRRSNHPLRTHGR